MIISIFCSEFTWPDGPWCGVTQAHQAGFEVNLRLPSAMAATVRRLGRGGVLPGGHCRFWQAATGDAFSETVPVAFVQGCTGRCSLPWLCQRWQWAHQTSRWMPWRER